MPKSRKGKKENGRKLWEKGSMEEAVAAVRDGRMGYLKAAKQFNVPRSTLFRLCKQHGEPVTVCDTRLGRKPVLSIELENELADYLLDMDNRFFGLTRTDVRRMAYQLAVANGIEHRFSEHLGQTGRKWLKAFLKRHSNLTLRKPTGTSFARVAGFNKANVNAFFDLLEAEMEKVHYPADRVFNVDETGLTVVQSRCSEVISLKG
ncbi:unnamed protein product [Acanthoscelides obtectus]|uniref:HTH CENPB-type domain-containing protein n=1 Tax=Acanthoscelides obtectus TaxID=200917 RepID=A0A9P0L8P1_ACAOB|nr:unnamed protein product [Acanthoscelides obtectus]CAK1674267.1 hypothetical protein AOBTE_LOCUS29572 [Acanthoscelides obtectus]